ncbi:MAG TPA: M48 family metalloprotease [Thermohalobaculum sp.]|nr:M48 family metalloprotease [Thermohalobaculum sp.]
MPQAVRSAAEQRQGDQAHRRIVAGFGGEYRDARVSAHVDGIGRRLAAVTEQPGAPWTFTVLDSPTINAFAIPGGYVYVTRGLLGLAGDEAQLAGVIGHEMGHVVAGHSSLRRDRAATASLGLLAGVLGLGMLGLDPNAAGALLDVGQAAAGGYLAAHSRGDEIEADRLGIVYLARAGYDPFAQAEFLDRLRAWQELQARIAGQGYDPNRVDFFSSHPASAERTRQAIGVARGAGGFGNERGTGRFLAAIDGIVWGDSARQGFVRGRTFSHTELGFTFTVPRGFTIRNAADRVTAAGPQGARFVLDAGRDPGGPLTGYIARVWAPAIARGQRTGALTGLTGGRINGLDAARAVLPVELGGRVYEALLMAVRLDGTVYQSTGIAPRGAGMLGALEEAGRSFRRLPAAQAAQLRERRIRVVTAQPGETAEGLARRMNVEERHAEQFRVLNGLGPGEPVRAGQQVKLVQ